jgi:hypothetical protein|nr:hypothetical protein [Kofleriaceae bacterium]
MTGFHFDASARAVLRSLVPVLCPADAVPLADSIIDHLELTLGAAPAMMGRGFKLGLLAYDLGSLPRYFRRAHLLAGDKAERYFASWEHGLTPLQVQLARALNQLVGLACYEQPEMTAAVGYAPAPWIEKVTRKRLSVYKDDIDKQARQILAPDPLRPAVQLKKVAHGRR